MAQLIEVRELSFADRIGGRWALAPQKWLITLFLMPLLAAGYTNNLSNTRALWLWMSFSLAGLCAVGVVDILLHHTLFKNRNTRSVPVWWVVVNSMFGGFLIGGSAWWGGVAGNADDSTQMAVRIPGLAILGAIWGVFLTLILDYRDRATTSRMKYVDAMVQLELVRMQQSAIVESVVQAVREETNREIARIRSELQNVTNVNIPEASALIRASASDAIQPLSKKLWDAAKNTYPTFRIRDVFLHSIRNQPFRPWALVVLTVGLSVVDRVTRLGVQRGFLVTCLIAVGVIVELSYANTLMTRFPQSHFKIFATTVMFVEIQTIALVIWERQMVSMPVSYAEIVISVCASVFLILVTVGIHSFDLIRGEVERFAADGIESERISSMARDRRIGAALREMANVLHGTVQTKLVSCAMALDLAAQAGDGESANAALLEARRVLGTVSASSSIVLLSLAEEISRKVAVWKGLCECSVDIEVEKESAAATEHITRIVEEGIANAVRHGGATSVEISILQGSNGVVEVCVRDNGVGPNGGSLGVGSAIIEYASGGAWSLTGSSEGAVLVARVALGD